MGRTKSMFNGLAGLLFGGAVAISQGGCSSIGPYDIAGAVLPGPIGKLATIEGDRTYHGRMGDRGNFGNQREDAYVSNLINAYDSGEDVLFAASRSSNCNAGNPNDGFGHDGLRTKWDRVRFVNPSRTIENDDKTDIFAVIKVTNERRGKKVTFVLYTNPDEDGNYKNKCRIDTALYLSKEWLGPEKIARIRLEDYSLGKKKVEVYARDKNGNLEGPLISETFKVVDEW